MLHVRPLDYAREAVVPAVAACLIPAVVGAAMLLSGTSLFTYEFVVQMACYSLLFAASFYWMCLRPLGVFMTTRMQES
jgi:hypothetical protein